MTSTERQVAAKIRDLLNGRFGGPGESWPGADVVQFLTDWMAGLGVDSSGPPEPAEARAPVWVVVTYPDAEARAAARLDGVEIAYDLPAGLAENQEAFVANGPGPATSTLAPFFQETARLEGGERDDPGS